MSKIFENWRKFINEQGPASFPEDEEIEDEIDGDDGEAIEDDGNVEDETIEDEAEDNDAEGDEEADVEDEEAIDDEFDESDDDEEIEGAAV